MSSLHAACFSNRLFSKKNPKERCNHTYILTSFTIFGNVRALGVERGRGSFFHVTNSFILIGPMFRIVRLPPPDT